MSGKAQKGFTLIELLVVVTIIGILAAAAIPKLMKAMDKARVGRCNADMAAVKSAAAMYYMDKSYYPGYAAGLKTEYLDVVPEGGMSGGSVVFASAGDAYTLTCRVKGGASACDVYFQNTAGTISVVGAGCP